MNNFFYHLFVDLGRLNQYSWFSMFNTMLIFLLLPLGLSKKIWASACYRILLLTTLLTFIVLSIISYAAPPIPAIAPHSRASTTNELYETAFRYIVISNDYTWFVIFNVLIVPIFILGLYKKYWMMRQYQQWVLASFLILALCSLVGVFSTLHSKL